MQRPYKLFRAKHSRHDLPGKAYAVFVFAILIFLKKHNGATAAGCLAALLRLLRDAQKQRGLHFTRWNENVKKKPGGWI